MLKARIWDEIKCEMIYAELKVKNNKYVFNTDKEISRNNVLMLSTGMKDNVGTLIYNKDILQLQYKTSNKDENNTKNILKEVYWKDGAYYVGEYLLGNILNDLVKVTIVGNTYENI